MVRSNLRCADWNSFGVVSISCYFTLLDHTQVGGTLNHVPALAFVACRRS
jgi:hypothetical protein